MGIWGVGCAISLTTWDYGDNGADMNSTTILKINLMSC